MPRILFTTSVARASPSTSSAMINSGWLALLTVSSKRNQVLGIGDLLFVDQDVALFQHASLFVLIGDEVRGKEAAVELHAFDRIDGRLGLLAFLDGDHAVLADADKGLGHTLPIAGSPLPAIVAIWAISFLFFR